MVVGAKFQAGDPVGHIPRAVNNTLMDHSTDQQPRSVQRHDGPAGPTTAEDARLVPVAAEAVRVVVVGFTVGDLILEITEPALPVRRTDAGRGAAPT
ncbi:hypothetical protein [Actinoplanes sp. TFC3]|uniref:hypothetical protein n=1 Tax=Actinoplanes sp. TFC3 TaxID=1710355 RepID=UPI000AF5940D|nr:hypothetical protein [Actinoplanes sp. TFC3]